MDIAKPHDLAISLIFVAVHMDSSFYGHVAPDCPHAWDRRGCEDHTHFAHLAWLHQLDDLVRPLKLVTHPP